MLTRHTSNAGKLSSLCLLHRVGATCPPCRFSFRAKVPVNSMKKPQWWRYGPHITEQNGNMIDASFNTGILYFRATNASREFVRLWIDTIAAAGKNIHGAPPLKLRARLGRREPLFQGTPESRNCLLVSYPTPCPPSSHSLVAG